jgi:UDP-N-acetylglucosamine 3-dehydrogenase
MAESLLSDNQLGFGVIGLGEIGQHHLEGLRRSPHARVAAVADTRRDLVDAAAAEGGEARAYADYHDLLADDGVQAVNVCVPHHLHLEIALGAIAAGKHVLVEKPLALTVDECDRIIAAAESAEVTVGVSHNQLFYPPHVRARELIEDGTLGVPRLLRLRLGIGGKFAGWRSDPAQTGGGLLFDAGVHRFYLARYLFGEVAEVSAVVDHPAEEGEDLAVVTLRFESGALGVIEANYHCPVGAFDDAVEVVGTNAILFVSGCEAEFESYRTGPALRRYDGAWHDERVAPGNWSDSVCASVDAFAAALAEGRPAPVSAADGRRVIELIRSVYETTALVGG